MKQNKMFSEVLASVTKYFLILVVAVIVCIFCSGIRVVQTGNVALILRCGRLVGDTPEEQIHEPGLLLAFPYIIDEVIIVPTDSVMEQSVTTYYTPDGTATRDGGYLITGDQNVAIMTASVKYVISDPVAYALQVSDMTGLIDNCVSTALLAQAAGTDVDVLLTTGKETFTAQALAKASEKLNSIGAGVTLTTLELTTVTMPTEVREVYNKVNSATIDAATILENAKNHVAQLGPYAEGLAAGYISEATSAYMSATAAANTALTEFWGVLEEYEVNPELVRTRIFSTKMTQILSSIGTVRVVEDGDTKLFLNP